MTRFSPVYQADLSAAVYVEKLGKTPGERITRRSWEIADGLDTTGTACRKGCSACCLRPVESNLPEAQIAAEYVVKHFSRDVVLGMTKQLRRIRTMMVSLAGVPETFEAKYMSHMYWCPFLSFQKSCLIYDVRPLSCRAANSTDENQCKAVAVAYMSGDMPPSVESPPLLSAQHKALEQCRDDVHAKEIARRTGENELGDHWKFTYFVPMVLRELERQLIIGGKKCA